MRLERVAAQVPAGARLADIGSDHGYLPVALLRRGVIVSAVAGEVAATPFRAAQRTVLDNDLGESIAVRQADGLAAIEPQDAINAVSLCGMGGETIRDILESGKARLSGHERLILQPNGGEQPLRLWLMHNGYRIQYEEVLRENRFDYEIIVAERAERAGRAEPTEPTEPTEQAEQAARGAYATHGSQSAPVSYTDRELYFGPLLLKARSPAFLLKWQRLLRLRQRTLASLTRARQALPEHKSEDIARQIRWISELLA